MLPRNYQLSHYEQVSHNNEAYKILYSSPFAVSFDKIANACSYIRVKEVKPYFANKFFDYDDNYPDIPDDELVSYMPFNVLLNRIDFDDPLYEKICLYVYDQIRTADHDWDYNPSYYELNYFIDTMINCNRIIPTKIIKHLATLEKPEIYEKAKKFDDEIRERQLLDGVLKNESREEQDDNDIPFMLDDILENAPLVVNYHKLKNGGCSEALLSWFKENFSYSNVLFFVAYNRLQGNKKYDEFFELSKFVNSEILRSESQKYSTLYLNIATACNFKLL